MKANCYCFKKFNNNFHPFLDLLKVFGQFYMNNKALINSFVWPGLPFCARLTLTVVVRFFLRLIFLIFFTANG